MRPMCVLVQITFKWMNPKFNNFSFIVFASISKVKLFNTDFDVSADDLRDLFTEKNYIIKSAHCGGLSIFVQVSVIVIVQQPN